MTSDVQIVDYDDRWAADFARLNYEWIERFFSVESHDREILDEPRKWVIEPGGQIFLAIVDGRGVGTVAMIPVGSGIFELTKMAVSPEFQGRGIADLLMNACIEMARREGAETIFLESHRTLEAALSLYRKHGFVETPTDPNSVYSRADIRMELAIGGCNL
ncbi:MAG: GNAT family N-acetyltransferase [Acidobacteria bacterium]|nr:GNAT family N-acetyltransferase [Acidobacteriota bacterium]MCW5949015.1 GNAT family N-acetyltransferase [Pyrinomonadaceae bacterium]